MWIAARTAMRGVQLVVALALAAGCRASTSTAPEIENAPASPPDGGPNAKGALGVSGRFALEEGRIVHIVSLVSGKVVKIEATCGDHVRQGQELAIVASRDADAWAWGDRHKLEAEVLAAEHDMDRQRQLFKLGEPKQNLVQAEDAYRKAVADLAETRRLQEKLGAGRGTDTYRVVSETDGDVVACKASPGLEVRATSPGVDGDDLFVVGRRD
jgi:multidrug efflux pump subunit AcrA (membrane-fusion protein)